MTNAKRTTARTAALGMLALGLIVSATAQADAFDVGSWIDKQLEGQKALSISAARLADGNIEYFHQGPLRPDGEATVDSGTRYQIGSLTKAFTHLLLAEMVDAGMVGYDTTVEALLGDRVEFANPAVGRITLLELATHTSGLPRLPANLAIDDPTDPYAGYDEDDLLAAVAMARNNQPLGDHYAYSNFGAGLLGYLLGRVHGGGYERALKELVINPMGLRATELDPGRNRAAGYADGEVVGDWTFDAMAGAGALWSSTLDLLRLARIHLGVIDNPLEHSLEADRKIMASAAGGFDLTRVWHVAESDQGPVYWHNGGTGGFGSFFGFRPSTEEAVIVLVSGKADPTQAGLQWVQAGPGGAATRQADTSVTGQYEFDDGAGIGVFERDGRIMAQLAGRSAQAVTPVGDDWYAHDVSDVSLRFVREDGDVVAVELVQKGRARRAARVAETASTLDRTEVDLSRKTLREYAGEYALAPTAKFTIVLSDDRLEAKLTGQPFLPIFAGGGDVFFYKAVDAELHFQRDEAGKVDALILQQGGIRQKAERID